MSYEVIARAQAGGYTPAVEDAPRVGRQKRRGSGFHGHAETYNAQRRAENAARVEKVKNFFKKFLGIGE